MRFLPSGKYLPFRKQLVFFPHEEKENIYIYISTSKCFLSCFISNVFIQGFQKCFKKAE